MIPAAPGTPAGVLRRGAGRGVSRWRPGRLDVTAPARRPHGPRPGSSRHITLDVQANELTQAHLGTLAGDTAGVQLVIPRRLRSRSPPCAARDPRQMFVQRAHAVRAA